MTQNLTIMRATRVAAIQRATYLRRTRKYLVLGVLAFGVAGCVIALLIEHHAADLPYSR
jgi:hypothetical protein